MKNIWLDGMMGLIVGDALGLPVQFLSRNEIKENPMETMQGFGTFHMPPGTWSDDSSMALATMISIQEKNGIDYDDIMDRFVKWNFDGEYTPHGISFDQGITCLEAINRYWQNEDYKTCGKTGEWANGNGALMRMLPVCLYVYEKEKCKEWNEDVALDYIHQVSALTHNHKRSKIACGIYYYMMKAILDEQGTLKERLQVGMKNAIDFYTWDDEKCFEIVLYGRLFELDEFAEIKEGRIRSTGYVIDSLEAAVWSLITTDSYKDAMLRAVNLGEDTDTIAAIAGGLAGVYYGYESIPKEWLDAIVKREWIEEKIREMKIEE